MAFYNRRIWAFRGENFFDLVQTRERLQWGRDNGIYVSWFVNSNILQLTRVLNEQVPLDQIWLWPTGSAINNVGGRVHVHEWLINGGGIRVTRRQWAEQEERIMEEENDFTAMVAEIENRIRQGSEENPIEIDEDETDDDDDVEIMFIMTRNGGFIDFHVAGDEHAPAA